MTDILPTSCDPGDAHPRALWIGGMASNPSAF